LFLSTRSEEADGGKPSAFFMDAEYGVSIVRIKK
jgi:hypothetical protein